MLQNQAGQPPQQVASLAPGFKVQHFDSLRAPLKEFPFVVALFLRPGLEMRSFHIQTPGTPLTIELLRESDGDVDCAVTFPDESGWETRVREAFTTLGLDQPTQSSFKPPSRFPGIQIQTIWRPMPRPDRRDTLLAFVRVIMERCCGVSSETIIQCDRCEALVPQV